ncbi:MAG: VWA domain-containing protein [Butyrivibrio sp.]|nr:VWA domain-containing protein [Muribaculum sp.]MCM1551501.1 VWA domain-containing protein [Butyrivibrio sp.]
MIFESLWPLFFLAAVPIIIILYLLKPKGVDHLMSSNLLWRKLLKNEQSRTFFEKFVHNILMYLQILIVGLLVISLMAPFIRADGQGGGRKILLIDTSGSMQHVGASGKSRLEEALQQACDYVRGEGDTPFCVVTADLAGVNLLAVDIADPESLVQTLQGITCSDSGGSLAAAQGILDTLVGNEAGSMADLIVYTDGAGAAEFEELHVGADKELHVVGEAVSNVANDYTVFTAREDGLYDVMVSMTNHSDEAVSLDVGLYDGEKLIGLTQAKLEASESRMCLFEGIDWQGQTLSSRLSGFSFAGQAGTSDSLEADNVSETVKSRGNLIDGLLVGDGNTFIEKAYSAVTGAGLTKAETDIAAAEGAYNVVIYDAGQTPQYARGSLLIFGDARGESTEQLENVVLDMTNCDLTSGLSGFTIGVNNAYCFTPPEGAQSFLEYDGKCVGYYGERDGKKEVVVGFDIRESDFPLRAEFPVFLANAMIYLSDTSWLATNVYYAGEEIALQPWAEPDRSSMVSRPAKAGLYQVGNEAYQEPYVVRFQTITESEGRAVAESVASSGEAQLQRVKRTLRNLFMAIALALLVVEWIVYVRQMRYRGKFYLAVRAVVTLCVVLALLGLRIPWGNNNTATIFVVDLSNSNEEHLQEVGDYLKGAVARMPAGNAFGIVTFGKDTLVEQFLTTEKYYGGLMTLPEKSATNFEEAVSRALTMIPGGSNGRIVMLTDGKETRGDIHNMAQALTSSQAEFLTLLYEDEVTDDAYIENVTLPAYLHPGDKYSITVLVASNYETDADIVLYNGTSKTAANDVHLNKGSNRFVFSAQVSEEMDNGAMESLRVQVVAPGDSCEENDSFSAYSVVEAVPRVLIVSGMETNVSGFASVLSAAGCDYSSVSALNAPDDINTMLDYKSIILVDTYIDDLPKGFLDNLDTYVKDYGCGFVCCGGEDSFALGGYRDTVLETVLPVDMELRGVDEMPSMAMVMVIDHSGSMLMGSSKISNLDIAIRAATVAVDNLRDSDYVGVLTFDDEYDWQVGIQQVEDREAIKADIKAIAEGGGTTIKPALQEACDALAECEASVKHVVLLTDGMGETTDFKDVISAYTDNGITLSTVAVGNGSDTQLLKRLADNCGGRYYYSDISSDIPKIFAQEVFLGGDSYIQNGEFALSVRGGHELTSNLFADGWPMLYGYVSSTPKTASSPVIVSADKEDPILTVWQYGLGRTVAWNSDVTGEWSGPFVGREDYVQMWKRIVDYSTGNVNMGEDSVDVVTAGELTELVYQTSDYGNETEILATVIDPQGDASEVKLHATAPGRYEADLSTAQTGLYHFNIRRTEGGEIQSYMTTAAAVQFSDEYKFDVSTAAYLSFVERYGRMITPSDDIWTKIDTVARGKIALTNWLLGLAICLFLLDVAMRRFQYVPKWKPAFAGGRQTGTDATHVAVSNRENAVNAVGASESRTQQEAQEQSVRVQAETKRKQREKVHRKPKREEQTLDTSQLLRKKDDRNTGP